MPVLVLALAILLAGCTRPTPAETPADTGPTGLERTIADFLTRYYLPTQITPYVSEVIVPASWEVLPGA